MLYEIMDVIDVHEKQKDDRLEKRVNLIRCEVNTYNTLHNITKLPEVIIPQNSLKVCDYKFIG